MSRKSKVVLLAAAVAGLVAVAAKVTCDAVRPPPRVYSPPGWRELTPQQREQRLDEEERRRRRSGRGPSRRLPEDGPARPAALLAPGALFRLLNPNAEP